MDRMAPGDLRYLNGVLMIYNGEEWVEARTSNPAELVIGLEYLRDRQRPMLEKLGHRNLNADTLARYGAALFIEVGEFLNETPWKVWRQKTPDREKIIEEIGDVMAFFGVWLDLIDLMGIDVAEVVEKFETKREHRYETLRDDGEGFALATASAPAPEGNSVFSSDRRYNPEYIRGNNLLFPPDHPDYIDPITSVRNRDRDTSPAPAIQRSSSSA